MRHPRFAIGILPFFMLACSTQKPVSKSSSDRMGKVPKYEHELLSPGKSPWEAKDEDEDNDHLLAFVEDWEGTPHRMGGNTQKGVDCSGFVIQAYLQVYEMGFLGRRAEDIFGETTPVKRKALKEGDLVFFKINGRRIDHVGIYISEGNFAHASSSRGVMISNLNEAYYDKRFFMGGRVKQKK